jgi:hypothetical protein
MIDLKGYQGFALMKGDRSIEASKLELYCSLNSIPIVRIDKDISCSDEYVPCGGVEWCLECLGKKVVPDYYPEWLSEFLYRKVWRTDKWPLGKKVFIKPAGKYKRFTGFVTTGTYKKKKKPPFWCSDIVHFVNEWRYYVADGKILCGEWYWGDEVNTPEAPKLDINIPEGYCGAIDFGMLKEEKLALIEVQHPFSCGWYGKDIELYAQWLVSGWDYMRKYK